MATLGLSRGAQGETAHGPGSGPAISPFTTSALGGEPHVSIREPPTRSGILAAYASGARRGTWTTTRKSSSSWVASVRNRFGRTRLPQTLAGSSLPQRAARGWG